MFNMNQKNKINDVLVNLLIDKEGNGKCIGLDFVDTEEYEKLNKIYSEWAEKEKQDDSWHLSEQIPKEEIDRVIDELCDVDIYREMVAEDVGEYSLLPDEIADELLKTDQSSLFYKLKMNISYHTTASYFDEIDADYEILEKKDYPDGKDFDDIDDAIEYWHTHDTGNELYEYLGMTEQEYFDWVTKPDRSDVIEEGFVDENTDFEWEN